MQDGIDVTQRIDCACAHSLHDGGGAAAQFDKLHNIRLQTHLTHPMLRHPMGCRTFGRNAQLQGFQFGNVFDTGRLATGQAHAELRRASQQHKRAKSRPCGLQIQNVFKSTRNNVCLAVDSHLHGLAA